MENASWGVGENGLDGPGGGGLFFEIACDAAEGAACSGGAGEGVDAAAGLVPDFWAGGFEVSTPVGCVVELVGPDGVFESLGVPFGLVVVVFWVFVRDCGHGEDFGAEEAEEVDFPLRLVVGHVDY